MSTLQVAKVASPATAAFALGVQVKVAPPGVVRARDTVVVLVVTVLPPASCTATTGWAAQLVLETPPPGCEVKPSLLAAPTVIVKLLLTAGVSAPSVAVSE